MPKITNQSAIATPSYGTAGVFSILAETHHINLSADGGNDIEEMDVHVQPISDPDFDLNW